MIETLRQRIIAIDKSTMNHDIQALIAISNALAVLQQLDSNELYNSDYTQDDDSVIE